VVSVGSYEAKTRLAELLRLVEEGERITITRHGRPVALLVPPQGSSGRTVPETVLEIKARRRERILGPDLSVSDLIREGRR
jgi:prevent-host-death family protein